MVLEEHMHIKLLVVGNEEMVDFYCLPTLDKQSTKVTVCSQQILIGNTAQCAIVFHNEPDGTVFGAILNNQNNWFLVYPDNFKMGIIASVKKENLKFKGVTKETQKIFDKKFMMRIYDNLCLSVENRPEKIELETGIDVLRSVRYIQKNNIHG